MSWQRHCLAEAGGRFGGREKVKEREDWVKESLEQQRDRRQFKNSIAAHLVGSPQFNQPEQPGTSFWQCIRGFYAALIRIVFAVKSKFVLVNRNS